MVDLKTLKLLVKLMTDNDLTELDIEGEGEKVKLKRGGSGAPNVQYVAAPQMAAPPAPSAPTAATSTPATGAAPAADAGGASITSPMVGTFYSSPSPDARPFVAVGDRVTPDTVVCIIEAMKVFNEIKAETTGVITRVAVESGQAVEFGQPLFVIKPA